MVSKKKLISDVDATLLFFFRVTDDWEYILLLTLGIVGLLTGLSNCCVR